MFAGKVKSFSLHFKLKRINMFTGITTVSQGWQCPVCKTVYAPSVQLCNCCNSTLSKVGKKYYPTPIPSNYPYTDVTNFPPTCNPPIYYDGNTISTGTIGICNSTPPPENYSVTSSTITTNHEDS